jgi:hypothetical protein
MSLRAAIASREGREGERGRGEEHEEKCTEALEVALYHCWRSVPPTVGRSELELELHHRQWR